MIRLSDYLKNEYHEKVYKLALSTGCTCPNRDGTVGVGGCTFCSAGGSGEFAAQAAGETEGRYLSAPPGWNSARAAAEIDRQIAEAKARISAKTDARLFIAYFQSFTNTYGDPDYLGSLFRAALDREEVVILSVGTRPDCISDRMLEILAELNKRKPVWIELGLQTAHDRTAERVNRGYPRALFEDCVRRLRAVGITVIVHVIFGLPGESREDMLDTIRYLAGVKPDGIKIQMLQILRGSRLAEEYEAHPFPLFTLDEYADLVAEGVRILPADMILHRMTGDGPRRLLIAPLWCLDKKRVLNTMNARMKWE